MTTKQSKEMALRMRRSFDFLFFCLFIFHVNGQTLLPLPPGFFNLDCGLTKEEPTYVNYSDNVSIPYIPDDQFVENGIKEEVDILPPNGFNMNLLITKRTFRGEFGTRGCYTFNVTKGLSILLRAYFYFGGREGSSFPQFQVNLGVNYWKTITSSSDKVEIIHSPTSNYLHLCLSNIGLGEPYINYIELRPIGSTSPHIYNTNGLGSLEPRQYYAGTYFTLTDAKAPIRYPVDWFDRLWEPYNMSADKYAVKSTTEERVVSGDDYYPPWKVVRSAILPINNGTQISWSYNIPENTKLYVVLHFTELQQNVTRYMNVTACNSYGCDVQRSLRPPEYLQPSSYTFILTGSHNFTISTSEQETPPLISATEEYMITPFELTETNDGDVDAVRAIKGTFKAKIDWQWIGDPCLPQNRTWSGITCSYNGNESPRITELSLSSCGLNGAIPQALANLTMLEKLDLSFNNLIGPVPDFLSSLQKLRFISIEGNDMTGPWPSALLHRQDAGLMILKGTFQRIWHSTKVKDINNI